MMGIFSEHLGKKYTEETEDCLNNVIAKNEKYNENEVKYNENEVKYNEQN